MGLQREEMTQKGGQFDRTMSQQQGMFDAGQTLQREDMAQRGGQFKQSMQADLGKFMASLQEQTAGRRSSENQALRSRMDEILGPAMQFISTGQPLPESEVTRMSLEGRRDPRVAAELDRFLSSPTLYDATTSRQNRREDYGDIVGPIDVASMLPWALGFTDSPEDERMNALRNLGRASGRTQGTIGDFFDGPRPPQQPANQGLDMSNPFVAALAKIFEGR